MLKGIFNSLFRFSTDNGGGGAGTTTNPASTGSDPGTSNAGAGEAGKAPAPSSTSGEPTNTSDKPEKTFSQADLDRIVKERLADERRRTDTKAAADKRAADEKALLEQGEFKTLAEQRAAELETTRAQAALADGYAKRLNTIIEAEIAKWPDEVKALDPGAKALEARLDWLERSRPLAQRIAALPKAPETDAGKGNNGAPPAPGSQGDQGKGDQGKGSSYRFTKPGDVSW